MIEFLHSAPYLYREDAYRDYCWAVDAYGAYQPASFIYLCSEAFSTFCEEVDIHTRPFINDLGLNEGRGFSTKAEANCLSPNHPDLDGLIIRITSEKDFSLIERYLHLGRNVLALLPNEWTMLLGSSSQNSMMAATTNVLLALNAEQFISKLNSSFFNRKNIWWHEIPQSQGRLFITEDRFISDALFMDGYGKSPENSVSLRELRQELGIFRGKFVTIALRNAIRSWICHEPITLIFDIQNRGESLEETVLNIELSERLEPIGATELFLPAMASLAKTSIALQVIPRLDGEYHKLFTISSLDKTLRIKEIPTTLTVIPKYTMQMRTQSRKDTSTLERLKRILSSPNAEKWLDTKTINNLEELVVIDPAACLNKIRSVGEKLAQQCSKVSGLNFANQIKKLQDGNLLSQKSIGYLHTIRVLGNLASHPSGEIITLDDVRIAAFALACVLEEVLNKKTF